MMSSQTRKTSRKSSPNTNSLPARPAKAAPAGTKTTAAPRPILEERVPEGGTDQVEIRIPADARWVRIVRLAAAGVASVLNFSVEEIEDIKSAVAEACNNAILHSQPAKTNEQLPTIIITMIPARDYLEIRVEDEGRVSGGITMPSQKAKTEATSSGALPVGGLGLLFIEAMMDEVQLQSGADTNTTLRMVKKRRSLG